MAFDRNDDKISDNELILVLLGVKVLPISIGFAMNDLIALNQDNFIRRSGMNLLERDALYR